MSIPTNILCPAVPEIEIGEEWFASLAIDGEGNYITLTAGGVIRKVDPTSKTVSLVAEIGYGEVDKLIHLEIDGEGNYLALTVDHQEKLRHLSAVFFTGTTDVYLPLNHHNLYFFLFF